MSIDEFFAALREAAPHFKWRKGFHSLRGSYLNDRWGSYCPITAVCRHKTGYAIPTAKFLAAAIAIGLSEEDANTIAGDADSFFDLKVHTNFVYPDNLKRMLEIIGYDEGRTD